MIATVDPITTSVVQHRLTAIVEEMGEAMLRTSYSQILNSSRDFSAAMVDRDCQLVAQAEHIPVHVGAMPWAAMAVRDYFGDDVHEGDLFLVNDPYLGYGSHLPDVTVFAPVFVEGEVAFWTINRAHHSDIGGSTHGAYNPAATEIFHEGLRIPPLRLWDQGKPKLDLLDMLAANVRHPRDFKGDLAAQIGSVKLGERRMKALVETFGAETVLQACRQILDGAEARTRSEISQWKDGVYKGEAVLDDDGHGRVDITIRATVTVNGSDIEVDLTASDPESTAFVNSSFANMQSACAQSLAYLIDPSIPKNAGAFRALKVVAKKGTIVWANDGKPVTMCTSHCSNEIIEAIIVALSEACPDKAMAGWGRRLRIAIKGEDPRNGKTFIWHLFHARPGGGASPGGDGWHNSGEWHSAGGLKFGSVEVAEARFPLHFRTHEFRPDSGGDGEYRGGAGVNLEMVVETDGDAVANTAGDGLRHGARGILGGSDGAPHDYRQQRVDGTETRLPSKAVGLPVSSGDVFVVSSGGGGGWGDPAKRTDADHASDKRDGFTSN
ncbi:MAG: hydantoinase B/oxoprolinase family protein [Alphaproteobacteria bacterium]|nr:hydantoinase B/oxoprolinase family protein [Alphaproteobacteria bacterium]